MIAAQEARIRELESQLPAPISETPAVEAATPTQGDTPAASSPDVEPVKETPVQAVEQTVEANAVPAAASALDALKQVQTDYPHEDFVQHLKRLADKGLAAVLNPADESATLRVVIQLVKEVIA